MSSQKNNNNEILEVLKQQIQNDWLVNYNNLTLLQLTQNLFLELENLKLEHEINPRVLLIESHPLRFIASFLATVIAEVPVFLGNPDWQQAELEQVQKLLQPNLIWGKRQNFDKFPRSPITAQSRQRSLNKIADNTIIGIPTGGSSGKIRFAIHTITTLTASVKGFTGYFEARSINSCCILPLYHVSGLMQLWRSLITQGNLAIVSYQDIKQGIKPDITPQDYFLSLVPTQLQFLLDRDPDWLCQFKTILLGGAPGWRSLIERARQHNIAVATTYGMTETASGITYLKPQDFLQGNNSSGQVLPHGKVIIVNQNNQNEVLEIGRVGTVKIQAKSLSHGYYPEYSVPQKFLITDDLGFLDLKGFLHIIGRNSQKIITGGKNVYPQEIEAAILATKLVKDVCVIGLEDNLWGQVVTAIFVPLERKIAITTIQQQLQSQLSKYKHPKYWLQIESLGRDSKGKINYSQLAIIARELRHKQK